jgi:hypothetical protein
MAADAQIPQELKLDLEQSRHTAARLMETLGRKLGAIRTAHYVPDDVWIDLACEAFEVVNRAVRRRPVYAIAAGGALGLLAGLAAGSALRGSRRA